MARKIAEMKPIDINQLVEEYSELSKKETVIKDRKKVLSEQIKLHSQKYGQRDDKGSFYCDTPNFLYGSVAKKKIALNFDLAKAFFNGRGLWSRVVRIVEQIDEDAVEKLVNDGTVSYDEFTSITKEELSYSVTVKKKEVVEEEDMPVVQAASVKKSPSVFKRR